MTLHTTAPLLSSRWRVAAASRTGTSHLAAGTPCQDAWGVLELPEHVLVAAVADGAGSAAQAATAARLAVDTLLAETRIRLVNTEILPELVEAVLRNSIVVVRDVLAGHAEQNGHALSDYHTTLACAVVTDRCLTTAHIGDGAMVRFDRDEPLATIAHPEHGEYANSTYFVTQLREMPERLRIRSWEHPPDGIALTTDGLLEVAFSDPYGDCLPWEPFFLPVFERVSGASPDTELALPLERLLESPAIRAASSDDLTLLIAICSGPRECAGS